MTLLFEVMDTGVGIAPRDAARLFTAFTQVDPARTRRQGGTGLGLAISMRLVRLMGGDMVVTSEGPGRGSRFAFTAKVGRHDRIGMGGGPGVGPGSLAAPGSVAAEQRPNTSSRGDNVGGQHVSTRVSAARPPPPPGGVIGGGFGVASTVSIDPRSAAPLRRFLPAAGCLRGRVVLVVSTCPSFRRTARFLLLGGGFHVDVLDPGRATALLDGPSGWGDAVAAVVDREFVPAEAAKSASERASDFSKAEHRSTRSIDADAIDGRGIDGRGHAGGGANGGPEGAPEGAPRRRPKAPEVRLGPTEPVRLRVQVEPEPGELAAVEPRRAQARAVRAAAERK